MSNPAIPIFALVILIMFSFAFDPQEETTREKPAHVRMSS